MGDILARVFANHAKAADHYRRALSADPSHVDALCSLCTLLSQQSGCDLEVAALKARAQMIAPAHPRVLELL
jgi:hypothetical protein